MWNVEKNVPKNQSKIDPAIFVLLGIIAVIGIITAVVLLSVERDDFSARMEENPQIPILILLSDGEELSSAQLLLMDGNTGNLGVYDIPRKIGAIIPALGRVDRIDNLYAEMGAKEVRNTLEGIFDLEIDFYLDLDFADVEVLVDTIDGVSVFMPAPIEDFIDEKRIRIPGGNVRLDGEKMRSYIRYEGDDERELEWISRRWTFVRELLRTTAEYPLLYRSDELFNRYYRHMNANFDRSSARSFLEILKELNFDSMITQRVLGNERQVQTGEYAQTILFPHFEGQLVRESVKQVSRSLGAPEAAYTAALNVQLEILNGTDINGLAARTQDLYENFGFEVLRIGNADRNDYEETVIIDRSGNLQGAERVGDVIRSSNVREGSPLPENENVDVTIVLGKDFDGWYVNSSSDE